MIIFNENTLNMTIKIDCETNQKTIAKSYDHIDFLKSTFDLVTAYLMNGWSIKCSLLILYLGSFLIKLSIKDMASLDIP